MCIRDRRFTNHAGDLGNLCAGTALASLLAEGLIIKERLLCLLYTSDAADERSSVDLGGRRIIKKKTNTQTTARQSTHR